LVRVLAIRSRSKPISHGANTALFFVFRMDDKRLIELDPVVCTQDRLHEHQDDANEVSLSGYVSMQVQMRIVINTSAHS